MSDKLKPSLLEPESQGGDTAEGGFTFQENVLLSKIPLWLSYESFTMLIREAIGDIEAKFFTPNHGFQIELIECKNYQLTPSVFWAEINRFIEIDKGSPGTYRWFTLASAGLSEALKPLVNGIRRLRGPYAFYDLQSGVFNNSFGDYIKVVENLSHSKEDAQFLFEKVSIEPDFQLAKDHGQALFRQAINDHLPEYTDLPSRLIGDMFDALTSFVKTRKNEPVTSSDLNSVMRNKIPIELLPPDHPILIHTAVSNAEDSGKSILFNWADFFGGDSRTFPSSDIWNQKMLSELNKTKDWIIENRSIRRLKFTGNRRLSTALAIGSVFSAVSGFSVDLVYRGETWSTDTYPSIETPQYHLDSYFRGGTGDHLVISIGILRNISPEVDAAIKQLGLLNMPALHLVGTQAILSPDQANSIVNDLKNYISNALTESKAKYIDLFYAGPSHLALFLGHRLNATAPVQCYERVGPEHYVTTCILPVS